MPSVYDLGPNWGAAARTLHRVGSDKEAEATHGVHHGRRMAELAQPQRHCWRLLWRATRGLFCLNMLAACAIPTGRNPRQSQRPDRTDFLRRRDGFHIRLAVDRASSSVAPSAINRSSISELSGT